MGKLKAVDTDKEHAVFSASGAPRWTQCPASIKKSEGMPSYESEASKEGTLAHGCLEFLMKNRRKLKPASEMAKKNYSKEMIDHALEVVDYVSELEDKRNAEVFCETKVDSSPFTRAGEFGTLDISIVQHFGILEIVDFKYGAGITRFPEGEDGNGDAQLVYYALAVAYMFDFMFKEIWLTVAQPRAYHESGNTIRTHKMKVSELVAWIPVFRSAVAEALGPSPTIKSGDWCKFCPAKIDCPEIKDAAMKRAQIVFSPINGVEAVPEAGLVKRKDLHVLLDACDKLEVWIKGVREHAYHVANRGHEIKGWCLADKRATRQYRDETIAERTARKLFGDVAFSQPKLLSPAQIEKAIKGHKKLGEWLKKHVKKESSGTTLVRDDGKREKVEPLEKVFGKVK